MRVVVPGDVRVGRGGGEEEGVEVGVPAPVRLLLLQVRRVWEHGRGEGIEEVLAALDKHRDWSERTGERDRRRRERAAAEIEAIALGEVRERFSKVHGSSALDASAARVVAGQADPYTAADELIASL